MGTMTKRFALALAVASAVGACSGPAMQDAPPPTPTPILGAASHGGTPTLAPSGAKTYQIGDTVTVTRNGADWAKVTVSDVSSAASYPGALADKPGTTGNIFIAARVTYEALAQGVSFNPYDWQANCQGVAADHHVVLYGPSPGLDSGHLGNGKKATGFIVFEVAPNGEVRLSYTAASLSKTPMFEVVIRAA
jgi:hypothetical protein